MEFAEPGFEKDVSTQRRLQYHEADVVIVGAGVAGSALAVALGNQGRSVILLESSLKQPNRIVGELLQPGGVRALEQLGLSECLEGIDAIKVEGYEIIYHYDPVHIPYPALGENGLGKRPEGRSFHHGRFIQKLREAALKAPNVSIFESTATEVISNEYNDQILGVECKSKGKKDFFFGALTVFADGNASRFRKHHTSRSPVSKSKFYGIVLIDAKLPRPQNGHVLLGDFSPILLYQIGTHETRILVDVPDKCITTSAAAGGILSHMRSVVLPVLPEGVKQSFEDALETQQIKSMPNSWLPPRINRLPGAIFLGDSANMRHPLTGGGMTVALNDVLLLADVLSPDRVPNLSDTKLVLRQMKSFHWRRKDVTAVINILAQALYSLFAASSVNLKALQRGCFQYFKLGGDCIDGPCGLLAGIIRNPIVLVGHFFAVAVYAIWIEAKSFPAILLPFALITRGFSLLWTACVVIFPYISAELKF